MQAVEVKAKETRLEHGAAAAHVTGLKVSALPLCQ
jgi:hypothetical protein